MKLSSKHLPRPKLGRWLFLLGTIWSLSGVAARAQNIDEGKSATRLFSDTCVNCHRSPRGLAKGRFRPTLFVFLQDHYTTSYGAAWELAAYLASVDTPQGKSRNTKQAKASTRRSSPRPPASVPSAQ